MRPYHVSAVKNCAIACGPGVTHFKQIDIPKNKTPRDFRPPQEVCFPSAVLFPLPMPYFIRIIFLVLEKPSARME